MMNKITKTPHVFVAVSFCFLIVASSCNDQSRKLEEAERNLDSLSRELAQFKHITDSLSALIEKGDIAAEYPIFFGKAYDTFTDPEQFIEESLRERPEEIPLDPVLGGTMAFRKTKVLTEDWVLGIYDDGHIQGKSIYQYQLQPDGTIKFTHITSREPE